MNKAEQAVRVLDRWQQRHRKPAFVVAVVKKFSDDHAGVLSANLAFSGFLAIFPILLLLVTVSGLVLADEPGLRQRVLNSALANFPVVGNQLGDNIHALKESSVPALVIALVGVSWSALGLSRAGLFAMAQVWNLPGPDRPDFWHRMARSFEFLGVLAIGLVVTTALASLGTISQHVIGFGIFAVLGAVVINIGQYLLGFRVLTPKVIPTRKLWPGAVIAGVLWTVLQALGGYLVTHELHRPSQVYGTFAVVIGLLAWVFLGVRMSVYAAELNTVIEHRLWPRSIMQPPLTEADRRAFALQASQDQRRPEQQVTVTYSDPPPQPPPDPTAPRVGAGAG